MIKIFIALLILPAMIQISYPQYKQHKSIQQLQQEFYSSYNFTTEAEFDRLNPYSGNSSLNSSALTRQVFGWNPYWVGTAYNSYNYSLLSTVAYFSYEVDPATGSYTTIHYWKTTDLIPLAHMNNVKVVLTVTNFGSSNNTQILSSAAKRQTLIDSIIALVQYRGADGVNIDFESVPSSQKQNLTNFMSALTSQIHAAIPNSKVSIDLPAVDWNSSFDVPALNGICDYMLIMGYDFHWSTAPNAGPVAPLQSGNIWGTYNVTYSVNYYLTHGASEIRLLLGVPYYGYDWPTVDNSLNSPTTGTGSAYTYSSIKPRAITFGWLWDVHSLTPWYTYNSSGWRQGWFDDSTSLGLKYDMVNTRNLNGIGIWALSYDGSYNELWNTIARKLTVTGVTGNTEAPNQFLLYQNYPNPFNPVTKIKFDLTKSNLTLSEAKGLVVKLVIYDVLGKEVAVPVDRRLSPGTYEVNWDASIYPGGIYFYKLETNGFTETKKMILIK
jgi:spore germination protein